MSRTAAAPKVGTSTIRRALPHQPGPAVPSALVGLQETHIGRCGASGVFRDSTARYAGWVATEA
jgi:hypothetical protein